jgi:hypothetical protein
LASPEERNRGFALGGEQPLLHPRKISRYLLVACPVQASDKRRRGVGENTGSIGLAQRVQGVSLKIALWAGCSKVLPLPDTSSSLEV